jgi:alkylation response protein AidB-like acyl-CoA dehydrogenase
VWISNGGIADVFTVFAQTPQADGTDKITAFIVERAFGNITSGKPEEKLGIRGSNTTTLAFDGVRIPAANVLGGVGRGFSVAMRILNNGRFGLGAGSSAGMRRMLDMIVQYVKERKQFGKPLAEFGLIKGRLAQIAESSYAASSIAYCTTALIDSGSPDAAVEAAMCKVFGSEAMWDAVNSCISMMGGLGFADGVDAPPFARLMRGEFGSALLRFHRPRVDLQTLAS